MDGDTELMQDRRAGVAGPRAEYRALELLVLKPSAGIKTSWR